MQIKPRHIAQDSELFSMTYSPYRASARSTRARSKLWVRRISRYPSLSPKHSLWSAWSLYPWQVPQIHWRFSRRSGFPAFSRRMSLAGTMWSTWRLIPACLNSTPHVSTSHFPSTAGVRRFPHPFRNGRGPGHFRSTRLQRTGLSWVLKRDPQ